jgi:hypothetical protein
MAGAAPLTYEAPREATSSRCWRNGTSTSRWQPDFLGPWPDTAPLISVSPRQAILKPRWRSV